MAKQIQLRRGTTAENNGFTGAVGEVSVDTDKDVLVVHDGVTTGGFPVAARANTDGTISLIKKDGTIISTINATGLFNNTLTSTNIDQALTAAQGKVLQDNKLDKTAITVSGSAPMYACRAWVNFKGTDTVAIRASGNVSSITDNGVGDYTINFTTAMPDANYSFSGFCNFQAGTSSAGILSFGNDFSMSAGSLRVKSANATTGGTQDSPYITVSVFR